MKVKAVLVALIVLSLLVGAFALGSYFGETPKPAPSGGNVVDNTPTTPPTPTVPHTETPSEPSTGTTEETEPTEPPPEGTVEVSELETACPGSLDNTKYGWGMRILNQDPWETLISFIISANNNITRIKGIIERLSQKFGREICWEGKSYYTFPAPESLACASEEDLKACGCGYRGAYIKKTAAMVAEGLISPYKIRELSYEEGHKTLLSCMGVGDKVADCILLFSMEKPEAFPVDVWVKRVMEYFYIGSPVPIRQIKTIAAEKFGKYAGLAQQYLFYYAREKKIGK